MFNFGLIGYPIPLSDPKWKGFWFCTNKDGAFFYDSNEYGFGAVGLGAFKLELWLAFDTQIKYGRGK
jgi:hypothetical protein